MQLLVHVCCAECWARTLAGLRAHAQDLDPVGCWYNPNIHPLIEYRRRLKALQVFMERDATPVVIVDEYGLEPFCRAVYPEYAAPKRCHVCYGMRLERAAACAAERGISRFTTTMVTSRHQDHGMIRKAGDDAAQRHGVEFFYLDLREAEVPDALVRGLYHQQYCGCVFSEYDRFKDTGAHLYRGRDGAFGGRDGEAV